MVFAQCYHSLVWGRNERSPWSYMKRNLSLPTCNPNVQRWPGNNVCRNCRISGSWNLGRKGGGPYWKAPDLPNDAQAALPRFHWVPTVWLSSRPGFLPAAAAFPPNPFFFFFLRFIYLFIYDGQRERERGRDTGGGRSRLHAGSLMWDSIPGLQNHALGQRQSNSLKNKNKEISSFFHI